MPTLMEEIGVSGGFLNNKKVNYLGFSFGELYYFQYPYPATREKLDFWDKAPLILFTGYIPEHRLFQGINLHFIFPDVNRLIFLEKIISYRLKNPRTILNLAWAERISHMGFSRDEYARILLSFRNYLPNKVINPVGVPFCKDGSLWKKAFAQVKPKWHGNNEAGIKGIMESNARELFRGVKGSI